ncbi:MAG: type II toxin-antitoxin system HicB family antitoxin [Pseudonocardiaceae bacterium]
MSFKIAVVFHYDNGSWWAEAPDVPDYVAWADTFDELRLLVQEGLEFRLERRVNIVEVTAFDFEVTSRADVIHLSISPSSWSTSFPVDLVPPGRIIDLSGGSAAAEERVAS